MQLFFSYILIALILSTCTLVISRQNPIHSILLLIRVFFLGTLFLFFLQREYYAILFLIVYVGAIVVLFLFIIIRLELKQFNVTSSINDLFMFRYLFYVFFVLEVLFLISQSFFDLSFFMTDSIVGNVMRESTLFIEANNYFDWSKMLQRTDHLRGLGFLLYTEYKVTVILASVLLFVSMVGALALTLYFPQNKFSIKPINSIKIQDVANQMRRAS
jgi:NADH:ubiquinone oxidoreductase subunit 6 (subunit J)